MGSCKRATAAAALSISDEDSRVDPHLGYPRAYAKLCRNAYAWMQLQGFVLPYTEGPPKAFLPYAARPDDIARLEQVQDLFPILVGNIKEHQAHLHKFKDVLWQQLDHLGNAGFDPACFRVDAYGNVLYWHADPSSPLGWEVCHWFPCNRGGKSVLNNLRLVHWQVSLKKKEKLEFLIPWWELQLGVSISQFLTAFESPNIGFRQRCLSYLFLGGEDEMPDGKTCISSHQWSHHFLDKQKRCGLAVAGLVRLQKSDDVLKSTSANSKALSISGQGGWTIAEEEALVRGYQQFGFGNWKAIKESEPTFANRSLVQIRDKYRSLTGLEKENQHSPYGLSPVHPTKSPSSRDGDLLSLTHYVGHSQIDRLLSSIKRESKIKLLRDEEKHMREDEYTKLQQTLENIKGQNEQEKAALDALEAELRKQRRHVEKQRQWNDTQTSYRLCLERMIQETMHQSVVYKEESRLNEIACNSLLAQLESQAETCSAAESRLIQNASKRQDLLQMTRPIPLLESGKADVPAEEEKHSVQQSSNQLPKSDHNILGKKQRSRKPSVSGASSKEDRQQVLQARDLQNHPTASKQESLSDSEDQHRNHKRFRKSTTPSKRSQSAPRQRFDKENCMAVKGLPSAPASAKKLDKLYYEGNRSSKSRVGESCRTVGHCTNSKVNYSQSENERMEKTKADDKVNGADERRNLVESSNIVESDGERSASTRTFKLMPVIKRDGPSVDTGYASCGSQRFRGILHAPQSRESSERFELDVSAIDSQVATGACADTNLTPETAVTVKSDERDEEMVKLVEDMKNARRGSSPTAEGGEASCDDESIREGKSTLDKWLQILLLSTEPTIEADNKDSSVSSPGDLLLVKSERVQEVASKDKDELNKTNRIARGWPEDVGVPPAGLSRGYSLRVAEAERSSQSTTAPPKKGSSDKLKVPFSGLLRRLSLRQQHSSSKAGGGGGGEAADHAKEPPRRQVTFEDWEGITNKLAAMNLDSTCSSSSVRSGGKVMKEANLRDARKLRSTSLRASTGSLSSSLKNSSNEVVDRHLHPQPQTSKGTKSVLYYSTENFKKASSPADKLHISSVKASSRRASIDECAQAWKKEVNRLEFQQQRLR